MKKGDVKAHIKELSAVTAPSGHERPAYDTIQAAWSPYVDEIRSDGLGNLIATRPGGGPEPRSRIMLCAHMDEIGLMVAEVRDGFIRTATLGGIDYRALLTQPVIVHARRPLKGVFAAASRHVAMDRSKFPSGDEMWIDVGLSPGEVSELVRVGDLITFDSMPFDLKGGNVAGKSLDDRAGVASITVCLDELARRDHAWDVVAVASVQEERGSQGALVAAYQVQPDIAIAIDTTFGSQRGASDDDTFDLGSGPTVGVGPNFHPRLVKALRDLAGDLEMKTQLEALPGHSGTDAWSIQVSRDGVPSLLLSIPIRNMHAPVEVVNVRDVIRTGRLMAAFIASLAPDFLSEIAWPESDDGKEENDE